MKTAPGGTASLLGRKAVVLLQLAVPGLLLASVLAWFWAPGWDLLPGLWSLTLTGLWCGLTASSFCRSRLLATLVALVLLLAAESLAVLTTAAGAQLGLVQLSLPMEVVAPTIGLVAWALLLPLAGRTLQSHAAAR